MAKLYFNYGVMNAGKSLNLIKDAYNYEESGRRVIAFKPDVDKRSEVIESRIGLAREAVCITPDDDIYAIFSHMEATCQDTFGEGYAAVFVDECQFFTASQIVQLSDIVDCLDIPVLCYGLRTDAFGALFTGSAKLFAIADEIKEIKGMCRYSSSKATYVMRVDEQGECIKAGEQVCIGGNERYVSCSRKQYKQRMGFC